MTFTLISCVYACGVAKPGHGSFTPLAVGLSLLACAGTGEGPRASAGAQHSALPRCHVVSRTKRSCAGAASRPARLPPRLLAIPAC